MGFSITRQSQNPDNHRGILMLNYRRREWIRIRVNRPVCVASRLAAPERAHEHAVQSDNRIENRFLSKPRDPLANRSIAEYFTPGPARGCADPVRRGRFTDGAAADVPPRDHETGALSSRAPSQGAAPEN